MRNLALSNDYLSAFLIAAQQSDATLHMAKLCAHELGGDCGGVIRVDDGQHAAGAACLHLRCGREEKDGSLDAARGVSAD